MRNRFSALCNTRLLYIPVSDSYRFQMDLKAQYRKDGFVHIPTLLDATEASRYRRTFQKIAGLTDADFANTDQGRKGWSINDAVTQREECWPLIFNPKLLAAVREILGSEIRYTQHSDLHVNYASCGWHRDSASRTYGAGSDWDESDESYGVVRVAIYFQSYVESGFRLGVVPGSHRAESPLTSIEMKAWSAAGRFLSKSSFVAPLVTVQPKWITINSGDCVIFDQRLIHSGSPIHGPKYSVYFSYGLDNEHSRNHVKYYFNTRSELNYQKPPAALEARLRQEDLFLSI